MSVPDPAGLLETSAKLDRLRKEQEEVLLEINKLHKKLHSSEFSYNHHRHFHFFIFVYQHLVKLGLSRVICG